MSSAEPATEPETKPQGKPNPTVRSVATLTGLVVGSAVLVGLFAIGGPLIAAGGLAAAGGATYVRHRMKNPRRSTGRTKKGWSISWGSKSRRVPLLSGKSGQKRASKPTGGISSRKAGQRSGLSTLKSGRGSGARLPQTTRSRARTSAGGVLPKHKASRPISSTTKSPARRTSVSSKPAGTRPPKTATRTAAKPGSSPRLTGKGTSSRASRSKGSRTPRGASLSATRRPSTRGPFSGVLRPSARSKPTGSGRPTGSPRPSTSRPTSPSRWGSGRLPTGLTSRLSGKRSSPTTRRSGTSGARRSFGTRRQRLPSPVMRTSPSGQHRRLRNPLLPTIGTPGRLRGRTKFGNPKAAHRPGPSRTRSRPVPYKRASARKLLRLSVGLPYRSKADKLKRPTAQQRRRARRTLRLRGLTYLAASRHLPKLALNKLWDDVYARVPQPPLKEWQQPTVPDLIQLPTRRPAIALGPSPITPEVSRNMSITEVVSDAFSHISNFQAEASTEVEQLTAEQPEMFKSIGQHYRTLADRMVSDMPFDPAVADGYRDLAAAIEACGDVAEGVLATMRAVHEADFARIENQRPREDMWNPDKQ